MERDGLEERINAAVADALKERSRQNYLTIHRVCGPLNVVTGINGVIAFSPWFLLSIAVGVGSIYLGYLKEG